MAWDYKQEAPKLQFEISPTGWMSGTLSQLRLQIIDNEGLFKSGCRLSAQFDDIYTVLLFCSVVKLCLAVCNPMDYSMPGFPVLHYLPELA